MIKQFFTFLLILAAWSTFSQTTYYSDRPDILELPAVEHSDLPSGWGNIRQAHIEMVAMMLGLYPDREIYFLARDSELLYDTARVFGGLTDVSTENVHLLNVSRSNMDAEHIRDYLSQEGINEEALAQGKKIVFVDTGFAGSIPATILGYFPKQYRSQMRTHLIISGNSIHPSARVFLRAINPSLGRNSPDTMRGTIINYEHLPRYTSRSNFFEQVNGEWIPASRHETTDGLVSQREAQRFMEDLSHYLRLESSITLFNERLELWRDVRIHIQNQNEEELLRFLRLIHERDASYGESFIRDLNDLVEKGMITNSERLYRNLLETFGLSNKTTSDVISNKDVLIKNHPEWAQYLNDPETGIRRLLYEERNLQVLGSIIDTIVDEEFFQILLRTLAERVTSESRAIIELLIEKEDSNILRGLGKYTFVRETTLEMLDLLDRFIVQVIETAPDVFFSIVDGPFSSPVAESLIPQMKNYLELIRQQENRHASSLSYFAGKVLKDGNPLVLREVLELYIEIAFEVRTREAIGALGRGVFLNFQVVSNIDSIIVGFINKVASEGQEHELVDLAKYTLANRDFPRNDGLIQHLIEVSLRNNFNLALASIAEYLINSRNLHQLGSGLTLMMNHIRETGNRNLLEVFMKNLLDIYSANQDNENFLFIARFVASFENGGTTSKYMNFFRWHREFPSHHRELAIDFVNARVHEYDDLLNSSEGEVAETEHFLNSTLSLDEVIETNRGIEYRVEEEIYVGRRGRVYRARNQETGQLVALKIAKDSRSETLASIAMESQKEALYNQYNIPHARILEQSDNYVVKEWIEGQRGDAWLDEWVNAGSLDNDPKLLSLIELFRGMIDQGIYVGDVRPKNVIFSGEQWIVVDSGGIIDNLDRERAWERLERKFYRRWNSGCMDALRAAIN